MKWRLIIDKKANDAYTNMAIDEAILTSNYKPTLRLYQWNPPAISVGYFQSLKKEVDIIESSVFRVKSITSQLLSLGRKDEGSFVPCNVNNILNDIIGGLKEREFKVADIELILKYDPDLPEISLDPDKIRQVFLNIINNAGDAILGPGSITIITKSDNENIYITIKDSGKGMSVDQMKQIFNPFYTTKEVGKGTGLGLSVSLGIVESMGGVINVQSLKEAGSAFTVSLPILKKRGVENG